MSTKQEYCVVLKDLDTKTIVVLGEGNMFYGHGAKDEVYSFTKEEAEEVIETLFNFDYTNLFKCYAILKSSIDFGD